MDFRVIISPSARCDLRECCDYISGDDPLAAERYCIRLIELAESLAPNPEMGRICPEFADSSIRDIVYKNHRIVYRLNRDQKLVEIARFWHGARGYLPDELES